MDYKKAISLMFCIPEKIISEIEEKYSDDYKRFLEINDLAWMLPKKGEDTNGNPKT